MRDVPKCYSEVEVATVLAAQQYKVDEELGCIGGVSWVGWPQCHVWGVFMGTGARLVTVVQCCVIAQLAALGTEC